MSSRAALASPIPVNTSYDRPSSSDRRKNMPSAVPPRTSSQQASSGNGSGNGSSSRKQPSQASGGERSTLQRYGVGAEVNGQASGSSQAYQDERSRRSVYPSAQEPSQRQTSGQNQSSRQANPPVSMPVRSQANTSSTSVGPSREASAILNSMVVSAPEDDPVRERDRAAMGQQQRSGALEEPAALVNAPGEQQQHGEETRRGGRSRHDFSKREKHTKFGEYILGNTIGEGEFGKVKLGWKQEGGIQVSPIV